MIQIIFWEPIQLLVDNVDVVQREEYKTLDNENHKPPCLVKKCSLGFWNDVLKVIFMPNTYFYTIFPTCDSFPIIVNRSSFSIPYSLIIPSYSFLSLKPIVPYHLPYPISFAKIPKPYHFLSLSLSSYHLAIPLSLQCQIRSFKRANFTWLQSSVHIALFPALLSYLTIFGNWKQKHRILILHLI